jgi:hypothetical protein
MDVILPVCPKLMRRRIAKSAEYRKPHHFRNMPHI